MLALDVGRFFAEELGGEKEISFGRNGPSRDPRKIPSA
jgi:hypothetical protein